MSDSDLSPVLNFVRGAEPPYFVRRLDPARRGLFAVAGAGLLMPASAFDGALYTDIGGAILAAIMVMSEIVAVRTTQAAAQS